MKRIVSLAALCAFLALPSASLLAAPPARPAPAAPSAGAPAKDSPMSAFARWISERFGRPGPKGIGRYDDNQDPPPPCLDRVHCPIG